MALCNDNNIILPLLKKWETKLICYNTYNDTIKELFNTTKNIKKNNIIKPIEDELFDI